ncbi:LacI family DNA-binding transcriptional regulator [Zongyangia hominis]|uniref:LacI family DNA-binding transcriptional regulator n=1 Tax=Zongyangia hominis TaxID=2763677 RepID=A0A926EAP9_9FIRM|nr:LacI family DNA-binding transcriptional regulator [Zongyangia hominis]MBC8570427.1 LacI family DNA-binding transcriptional regulator [Zongyangia hominis]
MKVSIKKLSELSGFSPATVSNVLNGKKGVNKDTAELIMKIARDSGYLSENRMTSIKLVVLKKHGWVLSDTPFFSSLIEGVEQGSRNAGYDTIICNLSAQSDDFDERLEQVLTDPGSGILLLATELSGEDVMAFSRAVAPVVVLDASFENLPFDTVLINNTDSVCGSVTGLIEGGHREIGYLKSSVRIQNFLYREIGYRRALERADLTADPKFTAALTPTMEGAYKDMARYLERAPKLPTAFFADNDIIALGAMKALKEHGCRIPEDVSVIGFDDLPFCEISSPSLSTIRVFKQEMGQMAVGRLIDKMKSPGKVVSKIQIGTEYIQRDSVRVLKTPTESMGA